MESNLLLYSDILRQHGIIPTFPITAKTLRRHPEIIKKFLKDHVEFAVHGYSHIDYTKLSQDAFSHHIHKAIEIFERYNIPFSGFRFPYLRWDKKFFDTMDNQFFKWDSSCSILWDVFKNIRFKEKNWQIYRTILSHYYHRDSDDYLSLPRFHDNILEIPVSLPDDVVLIDRLGIKDEKILSQILLEILKQTYLRGELFTLQIHPERIFMYKNSLNSIIKTAKELSPSVWITSLNNIYEWWKEKNTFSVKLNSKGKYQYEVHIDCAPRAALLIRFRGSKKDEFYNGYSLIKKRRFSVKSRRRPVVGVPKESPSGLIHFLKNEGFIFEISEKKDEYCLYLDNFNNFSEKDEMKALAIINTASFPLIRFWRWPSGYQSTLAITGDIDVLSSLDLLGRFL